MNNFAKEKLPENRLNWHVCLIPDKKNWGDLHTPHYLNFVVKNLHL